MDRIFGVVCECDVRLYSTYPVYRSALVSLVEYNGKFICNQYVLRGGSCATSRLHIRFVFFFQAEDGIRDIGVTGVQRVLFRSSTCGRSTMVSTLDTKTPVLMTLCRTQSEVLDANRHTALTRISRPVTKRRMGSSPPAAGDRKSVV